MWQDLVGIVFQIHRVIATASGFFELPVRRAAIDKQKAVMEKRDEHLLLANMRHENFAYYTIFSLGTPPQKIEFLIDTGSSDAFVYDPLSDTCQLGNCKPNSVFDYHQSVTNHNNHTEFETTFSDLRTLRGIWVQDSLLVDGRYIPNFNFAVVKEAGSGTAILGIGPVDWSPEAMAHYQNFPIQLKRFGYINHLSYSIWLNGPTQDSGTILFGGYDRSRMMGILHLIPWIKEPSGLYEHISVKLSKLTYISKTSKQTWAEVSMALFLDTGTAISTLPADILDPFYRALNARLLGGVYIVPCHSLVDVGSVSFKIAGLNFIFTLAEISVQLPELPNQCVPGFLPHEEAILGANILQTLYIVHDLENRELAIAVANTYSNVTNEPPQYFGISCKVDAVLAPLYYDTETNGRVTVSSFTTEHG